jgi:hypothetical protein
METPRVTLKDVRNEQGQALADLIIQASYLAHTLRTLASSGLLPSAFTAHAKSQLADYDNAIDRYDVASSERAVLPRLRKAS